MKENPGFTNNHIYLIEKLKTAIQELKKSGLDICCAGDSEHAILVFLEGSDIGLGEKEWLDDISIRIRL